MEDKLDLILKELWNIKLFPSLHMDTALANRSQGPLIPPLSACQDSQQCSSARFGIRTFL